MQNENSICCIFNFAPHYRKSIYTLMDNELSCDFYFGDKVDSEIKTMDVQQLVGYKKTVQNMRNLFGKFWWQKGVVHLVFKKQYKHFILTGDSSILSSWLILLLCGFLKKKTYIWMHGLQTEPSWKGKLLNYPFYCMADKFLLYGNHAKQLMIKLGFAESKIELIYNSLDYQKQLAIRKKIKKSLIYANYFTNILPTVIYIGRIQKVKKLDLLFSALKLLEEKKIFCNLMLIGENTDNLDILKIHTKNNLLAKFWDYGPCYDETKIAEFLYSADVCVSPGNIGLTALHSIGYGTPVITHNNFLNQMPEFEAIKAGKTGDFFNENDVNDLSNKIEKWLNLQNSEREFVRKECYALIDEKYNPYYQINILKNLLLQ